MLILTSIFFFWHKFYKYNTSISIHTDKSKTLVINTQFVEIDTYKI